VDFNQNFLFVKSDNKSVSLLGRAISGIAEVIWTFVGSEAIEGAAVAFPKGIDGWVKLSAGGEKGRCGWLKDKFGLSWQTVPSIMAR
jgi:hypothetical protein